MNDSWVHGPELILTLLIAFARIECAVLVVGRAEIARTDVWLGADPLHDCLSDARFANAGLAGDQDHLPVAARLLPSAKEQIDLLIAANQGSRGRAHRFKPALDSARAQHLPCRHFVGETLQQHSA